MLRTLHVDIEGGFGGSARSLYELVTRLPHGQFKPLVMHREMGPVVPRYAKASIATRHVPTIASWVPRRASNAKILIGTVPRFLRMFDFVGHLRTAISEHNANLVHFNYEGLFAAARLLRRHTPIPFVFHCRTQLPANGYGRFVARQVQQIANHLFFISDNEREAFAQHCDGPLPSSEVLWNISSVAKYEDVPSHAQRQRLAAYFGAINHEKGVDRLLDVALALRRLGGKPLKIEVYGGKRQSPAFYEDMERQIQKHNLSDWLALCGHTQSPESVMARALIVLRVSRWDDPWGRDLIEAACNGTPAFATGTYEGVVQPGVTGELFSPFDANFVAARMARLVDDENLWQRMSTAALERAGQQFGGEHQVRRVARVFKQLSGAREVRLAKSPQ